MCDNCCEPRHPDNRPRFPLPESVAAMLRDEWAPTAELEDFLDVDRATRDDIWFHISGRHQKDLFDQSLRATVNLYTELMALRQTTSM